MIDIFCIAVMLVALFMVITAAAICTVSLGFFAYYFVKTVKEDCNEKD